MAIVPADTNVLSPLMQTAPNAAVVSWFDERPTESLWATSATLFEVRLGQAQLPAGWRRGALEAVRLVEGGQSIAAAARTLGVVERTLFN
ncbi:MAG: hypothetical protein ACK5OR_00640, partial [Betaproteobacteria bacterium]